MGSSAHKPGFGQEKARVQAELRYLDMACANGWPRAGPVTADPQQQRGGAKLNIHLPS